MTWLAVGAGGALGAMARHALNGLIARFNPVPTFPLGIFLINAGGSAAIGIVAGLLASGRVELSADTRLFVMAGLLGGFTTFSSFSLDTLMLVRSGHAGLAALNVAGQVLVSLVAVAIGYRIVQ
jgi:CrcB protein